MTSGTGTRHHDLGEEHGHSLQGLSDQHRGYAGTRRLRRRSGTDYEDGGRRSARRRCFRRLHAADEIRASQSARTRPTPIVVVNKIDRPNARPAEVVDEVLDLFIELEASDEQLDFPVVYAVGLEGHRQARAGRLDRRHGSAVRNDRRAYSGADGRASNEPLQFLVTLLDYNEYLGRIAIGRVNRGISAKAKP